MILTKKQFYIRQFLSLIFVSLAFLILDKFFTVTAINSKFLFFTFFIILVRISGILVDFNFGYKMYYEERIKEILNDKKELKELQSFDI